MKRSPAEYAARACGPKAFRSWRAMVLLVIAGSACTLPRTIVLRLHDANGDIETTAPVDAIDAVDAMDVASDGDVVDSGSIDVIDAPHDVPPADVCMSAPEVGTMCSGVNYCLGGGCGSDAGACRPGTIACTSGRIACTGAVGPMAEVCNGIDDDCNGLVDDGASICPGMYCSPTLHMCCTTATPTSGGCTTGLCGTLTCYDRPGPAHLCCG